VEDWQASFLAADEPLFIAAILEFMLNAVQLIDHCQRDIGPPLLPLGVPVCKDEN
jgi:hypothetical protein